MRKLDDERLVRRAGRGDRRAFEAIYRRYHQQLYRFCVSMVGNPEDAQEALQNTMVKVLRSLPGERRQIDLKPWLYRIARNEAVEVLRRRREGVELSEEHAGVSPEIAATVADRERLRRLFADLRELPDRQRDALVMRELAGLSFVEIAAALETTPAAARQTAYEARLSLHELEEGREMRCEAATRLLSDCDGRVRRRRDLRAHLRACPSCRRFREEIEQRRSDLAALAPLPAATAIGVLHSVGGSVGAGAGKAVAGSALAKTAAGVAVVAAIGVSAADREGLIELTPGGGGSGAVRAASPGGSDNSRSGAALHGPPGAAAARLRPNRSTRPAKKAIGERD